MLEQQKNQHINVNKSQHSTCPQSLMIKAFVKMLIILNSILGIMQQWYFQYWFSPAKMYRCISSLELKYYMPIWTKVNMLLIPDLKSKTTLGANSSIKLKTQWVNWSKIIFEMKNLDSRKDRRARPKKVIVWEQKSPYLLNT